MSLSRHHITGRSPTFFPSVWGLWIPLFSSVHQVRFPGLNLSIFTFDRQLSYFWMLYFRPLLENVPRFAPKQLRLLSTLRKSPNLLTQIFPSQPVTNGRNRRQSGDSWIFCRRSHLCVNFCFSGRLEDFDVLLSLILRKIKRCCCWLNQFVPLNWED